MARTHTQLELKPMLLGGVFQALGTPQNLAGTLSPQKAQHSVMDQMRWAEHWAVPLRMPATHPQRSVEALRATLATSHAADMFKIMRGFFEAYWVLGLDISQPPVMEQVFQKAGVAVPTPSAMEQAKLDLRTNTDAAIAHGIFGAPSFRVVGRNGQSELFWGQDRLEFVECALGRLATTLSNTPLPKPHSVELFWDFSSPFSYLAVTQTKSFAERTGITISDRPVLLGALFRAIGQVDAPILSWSDPKRRYAMLELTRWADHWDVPFVFPADFPLRTVDALRTYLALPEPLRTPFRDATFHAAWGEGRNIGDRAVLAEILVALGAEPAVVFADIASQPIKDELFAATKLAIDAGVFGVPTFRVDQTELYWGQDRLSLMEARLRG